MVRAEIARKYFLEGYNCSQSVMLAFQDELGLTKEQVARIALPMGGGIGRMRLTCGGLTGAALCLGLLFPEKSKNEIYALVQEIAARFEKKNGSLQCGALLSGAGCKADTSPTSEPRTAEFYQKRPCANLIASGAEILETLCKELKRL